MTGSIDTIKLHDGSEIPWLAWGCGSGDAMSNAVNAGRAALGAGLNHIDTAQIYRTEPDVKQAIEASGLPRSSIYVTTKKYKPEDTDDGIRSSIDSSIENLGGVPDLFLLHSPFIWAPTRVLPVWRILEEYKDAGKLKAIGVSNFRPQDLETLLQKCKHKPVVNQLEFHPLVLKQLEPLLELHKKHGIVVESYGPLTPNLRLSDQQNPLKWISTRISKRLTQEAGEAIDENAVLLLWCKAKNAVAVTTSTNPKRVESLARIANLRYGLTPDEVKEIDGVGRQYHFRFYTQHMTTDFALPDLPTDHVIHGPEFDREAWKTSNPRSMPALG